MSDIKPKWDHSFDIVVIGSGAGGLVAGAVAAERGASTLVLEKTKFYGGTSATSGGGVWIPASHSAQQLGQDDDPQEAFKYIKSMIGDQVQDAKISAFVNSAKDMAVHIESISGLKFQAIPYTDYQAELPGGKLGYRSHETNQLCASELTPEDFKTLRPTHPSAALFGYIPWTTMEAGTLVTRAPGWKTTIIKILWRYYSDIAQRLRSKRSRFLVFGNAIAGHLKLAMNRFGAELWLESPTQNLITDSAGKVIGVELVRKGKTLRIEAKHGVILAAGGFERNGDMRDQYLLGNTQPDWSGGQEGNTGDIIRQGMKIGARTALMEEAWWAPTIRVDGESRARPLFFERAFPGSLMVNQDGQRYMNEAQSYDKAGKAMLECDSAECPSVPSWLIFDARFRKKFPLGPLLPIFPDWIFPKQIRAMYTKASSLEELAASVGLPGQKLLQTVSRYNSFANTGKDLDFGRGDAAYDRYYGDQSVSPNPNLAPVDNGPFYAIKVFPGDIGTKGGLDTDEKARVLNHQGLPIEGLYATGNCSASVMGSAYPGAGSTLGPAMTFGYLAVLDALKGVERG